MQFIKPDINIDFIGRRQIAFAVSAFLLLLSIGSLIIHKGPRYGVDFAGGAVIRVKFTETTRAADIAKAIEKAGIPVSTIQTYGAAEENEFLIRAENSESMGEGTSEKLTTALKDATGNAVEIRQVEMVGPKVGKELREQALFTMFYTLLFITIYISGRFELKWLLSAVVAGSLMGGVYLLSIFKVGTPFLIGAAIVISLVLFWYLELKFAMGAIVALLHDVLITVGMFSLFNKEFNLPVIAALLTIIGYSLNDTIIVFDRIRENQRRHHKLKFAEVINRSINETLSRTILTSITTVIVVVSLFVLGGGIIHDFAFALIVGVMTGTYSSIFVASPILLSWQNRIGAKGRKTA